MDKNITDDRPSISKAVSRTRSLNSTTVSASALAQHLDVSRTYIGKLEAEGVLQSGTDGFPLDQSRVAYLQFLRRERKQSPRSEADTDFQRAKAGLIRLRINEKQRTLIPFDEAISHVDEVVGLFISRLSGFAARCGGGDLALRRQIDRAVFDLRVELADAAHKLADECREPPLGDA